MSDGDYVQHVMHGGADTGAVPWVPRQGGHGTLRHIQVTPQKLLLNILKGVWREIVEVRFFSLLGPFQMFTSQHCVYRRWTRVTSLNTVQVVFFGSYSMNQTGCRRKIQKSKKSKANAASWFIICSAPSQPLLEPLFWSKFVYDYEFCRLHGV